MSAATLSHNTFGDKRSLYLKALAHYRDSTHAAMRGLFRSSPTVREAFAKILFGISAESPEEHARGCLLLSANMQRTADDSEVAEFLLQNQQSVESIFRQALRKAQAGGELSKEHDPAALARFFVVTIQGMRSTARLKSDRKGLEQVARVALKILE